MSTQHPAPGSPSPIALLPNLRDLGGWSTADGRTVRSSVLYRSTDFRTIGGDVAVLEPLGLRTVYDLRSQAERSASPDPSLPGAADVALDVLADDQTAIPGNLDKVLSDPKVILEMEKQYGGKDFDPVSLIVGTYRDMIAMPSALTAYRRFYRGLLGADQEPALFHCTTGKDRTGWAAASFLTLMGVGRDEVYHDYLLTNDRLLPSFDHLFEALDAAGGNSAVLKPVLGVRADYLDAAFTEVDKQFGGMAGYFEKGLQLDSAAQQQLRDRFLVG
ncbi:tyrosine-protein phosphatase [Gordonia sp. VNK21]|uniref:tyrosine-protein phosphatase n=1 Tax=Gordonia sp. VNK21 TaxID=3382483 RepID=UPI0038D46B4F